ncbi:MAG: GtrA family protein [Candidatus Pristimantibacillus sp.]
MSENASMSAKEVQLQQEKKQRRLAVKQFLMFNMVGLINTIVDFLLYSLLIWAGWHYIVAQIASYAAGMINSYTLNSWITFRKPPEERTGTSFDRGQMIRFVSLNLGVLSLSLVLLYVLTDILGANALLAKFVVTCLTVLLNFVGSKKWVFRR